MFETSSVIYLIQELIKKFDLSVPKLDTKEWECKQIRSFYPTAHLHLQILRNLQRHLSCSISISHAECRVFISINGFSAMNALAKFVWFPVILQVHVIPLNQKNQRHPSKFHLHICKINFLIFGFEYIFTETIANGWNRKIQQFSIQILHFLYIWFN